MTRSLDALKTDSAFYLSRSLNRSFNRPDWVSINLTLKCNLHCTMCNTCYDVPKELSREEIFDIIDQVALWGVRILNPLGGEPFYRPDIVEILQYAVLKDFYITVTTNGTLITPEHAEGIARIAYDRLHFNFSIDGFKEVHDRIRGAGNLERTLEGLRYIREADAKVGSPPRKIIVNSVVNNLNLDAVPAFLEYCRAQGFQGVQLLNLFKKNSDPIPREIKHMWIPRERWGVLDEVVDKVIEYKEQTDPQQFLIVNSEHELQIMKQYYRGTLPPRKAKCYAGWKELYINADGSTVMCDGDLDFLKGEFGNVRQQTLQELWHSDKLRERREAVKACTSPCIQDCYLRESSDSMLDIARELLQKGVKRGMQELKRRLPMGKSTWVPLPDSELTLELSDVCDVHPSHDPQRSADRFQQLTIKSTVPFERCYDDPFEYYDMRNRGHLNFNRGFMGLELLKSALPSLAHTGTRMSRIRLGLRGDPLLHPEFNLALRYVLEQMRDQSVASELRVETFGTLLNTEYVDIAIAETAVRQTWMFIIDAGTASGYQKINHKDLWAVIQARLDYFLAMKARHKANHIRLALVFTCLPDNQAEAEAFVQHWQRRFVDEGLEAPAVQVSLLPEWLPGTPAQDTLFFRRKDNDNFLDQMRSREALAAVAERLGVADVVLDRDQGRMPRCAAPFKTPTITWDGKVTVCDQDKFLKLKVGEVTTEALAEIWWQKDTTAELRRAVQRGELPQRSPCRDCRQPFSPNAPQLTEEEMQRYSKMNLLKGWQV